ncbi:MAG: nucleotidyltransferase family protein [Patescibacteria group bacterium]|nr:nucleotidyltransferase family protein [Patescibacteria group bacterium]MDE2217936.1 nucleotidyltransferase family protein [Patescibacteria group bacterium]
MNVLEMKNKISPVLKKYGIKRAAVFGSVSRGDDSPKSDVDIMVSLGKPMGMFAYMGLVREIEKKLDRKVDLVTENSINKFVRPYIQSDLKTIYER